MATNQSRRFQIGDVVRLQSGGAAMTVTAYPDAEIYKRDLVECCWLDHHAQFQRANLPEEALLKVDE